MQGDAQYPDVLPFSAGSFTLLVMTESLGKQYRAVAALENCTLGVEPGEVFGLLGPNGAGKTTLLRLLLGFLRPTSGRASIAGLDCYRQAVQVHRRVSYLPGEARLYRGMRGRDALQFFSEVRPEGDFARALELASKLELDLSRRVAFMSTGMRQKLALVTALSARTELIILDEPTSNLDPTVRATVGALVLEAKQLGRTVLFSSHVLAEVEEVCDRVVILRGGRLVHTQPMSELRRQHRILLDLNGPLPPPPVSLADQVSVETLGNGQAILDTSSPLPLLLSWLATLPVREMRIEPIGLRAIYERFHPRIHSLGQRGRSGTTNSPPPAADSPSADEAASFPRVTLTTGRSPSVAEPAPDPSATVSHSGNRPSGRSSASGESQVFDAASGEPQR